MRKILIALFVFTITITLTACSTSKQATGGKVDSSSKQATIKTNAGSFVIELDAKAAPNTVANFVKKSTAGDYAGRTFHRVEDWVVQGGDPKGNGTGGGDQATELSESNFSEGAAGIARAGDIKVSNADQFFICTVDCSFLNKQYTYFGKVSSGMDVVKKIKIGDKIESITIN
jgi:peptidyl-prolyl cis-trans isomerase B (cyclophilin B)